MRSNYRLRRKRSNVYLIESFSLCIFLFLLLIPVFGSAQDVKKENQETPEKFSYLIENGPKVAETPPHEPKIRKTEKISTLEQFKVPVWEIGDTWVFQSSDSKTWSFKVVRVESNLIVTENSRRSDFLGYDKKTLEPKYTIDQSGKRTKPTVPYVDFPLYVGKKWKQNVPSSSTINIIREYKCLSFEDVTVPAGRLKAAKIKFLQTSIGSLSGGYPTSGSAYIWYSPR